MFITQNLFLSSNLAFLSCYEAFRLLPFGITWVLHIKSQLVRLKQLVVHAVLENRHAAAVTSCLRVAGAVDEQVVKDFIPFALHFKLVAALDSGPTDGAVGVHSHDGVQGGVDPLQGPGQHHRHVHLLHLTNQTRVFPHGHLVFPTYKPELQE